MQSSTAFGPRMIPAVDRRPVSAGALRGRRGIPGCRRPSTRRRAARTRGSPGRRRRDPANLGRERLEQAGVSSWESWSAFLEGERKKGIDYRHAPPTSMSVSTFRRASACLGRSKVHIINAVACALADALARAACTPRSCHFSAAWTRVSLSPSLSLPLSDRHSSVAWISSQLGSTSET